MDHFAATIAIVFSSNSDLVLNTNLRVMDVCDTMPRTPSGPNSRSLGYHRGSKDGCPKQTFRSRSNVNANSSGNGPIQLQLLPEMHEGTVIYGLRCRLPSPTGSLSEYASDLQHHALMSE